ncbi:ATP-dependent zinc protease [Parasphingopyxis algicola]|uniref:ATP-dependent zinc protease family protein n=1 Tax=Parasphingopyxis algicola TaxID=2026624 RepID=UPI0015A15BAB|nr:RimK/LysX family protein [Parasphingopyxis algicola]QLC26244.1 ATP-dependent zinc protease [Parasphingopyxis algicola]
MNAKKPRLRARLKEPVEIGWCELVDLPDLGLFGMHAKIDTGARTSSLHATRIKPFERDGKQWVRFHSPRSAGHGPQDCEAPLLETRQITSSNGSKQTRYVIRTVAEMGPLRWRAQITLANRATMAFPVLVGRRALKRGFLVNSGKRWLLGTPPKEGHGP